jgi:hypothetical protein
LRSAPEHARKGRQLQKAGRQSSQIPQQVAWRMAFALCGVSLLRQLFCFESLKSKHLETL